MEAKKLFPDKSKYSLIVLPIFYGILSFFCYYQNKSFFSSYPDSIYIYLTNATNIASGNLDIGHYDNPGTPVHILGGLILFITHFFVGKSSLLYQDVFANPEFYLRFCVGTFGLFLILSTYFSARLVLKHTGNLIFALFFQLLPVCSYFTIYYLLLVRMCPENLIIAVLVYYYAFLWVLCYQRNSFPDSEFSKKSHVIFFALISALLVTTKMTCLPFLIVPLFFIKNFFNKCWYVLLTIVFGALMLYPVWPKLPDMYIWFMQLATHSGNYGTGEAGVSLEMLFSNLLTLFKYDLFFSSGYLLLSVALIVGYIKKTYNNNFYKLILAFWIICSVQLVLASKQFGYHYLIASQMLIIPGVMGAYELFRKSILQKLPGFILFGSCLVFLGYKINQGMYPYKSTNKIYESSLKAKKYANLPKIITTGFQGACFPESALRFGSCYGGPSFHNSNYFLRKTYPNSYFYDLFLSPDYVKAWDINVYPAELFEKNPQILVYFLGEEENTEKNMLNRLTAGFDFVIKKREVIEYNEETRERFYMLTIDTSKIKQRYTERIKMVYDFENKTPDNSAFVSSDGRFKIGEPPQQSKEKSFSGSSSIKILNGQYSCLTTLAVKPGDSFDISVNSYSEGRPVGISLSTAANTFDRKSEAIVEDYGNGWKKINLKAIIPENFKEKEVTFCLYYYNKKVGYIDDLSIVFSKSDLNEISDSISTVSKFILKAANNKYVSVSSDKAMLTGMEVNKAKAEIFELIDLGNGKSALKAANGKFVIANRNMDEILLANSPNAWEWETFQVIYLAKNKIKIKSSTGKFVGVDSKAENILIANHNDASEKEIFTLETKLIHHNN